ncbi:thiopeptide-type bacteriocin biosynthesis protein [Streptomyces sp. NPDC053048]|uniref:thiopeptide-type bacteriocin biosynthesis protein n=1 Tax=Streptomyces sp. NPDC053048 TaxID=3365694 RepID=UPI0037CE78FC
MPRLIAGLGSCHWWVQPGDAPVPYLDLFLRDEEAGTSPGLVMQQLGWWAQHLVEDGVVADVALVSYRPHIGQWGSGPVLRAAERCFAADSAVVAQEFLHPPRLDRHVLAAVHMVDIAAGFHGGRDAGMQWLAAAQPKPVLAVGLPRDVRAEADRVRTGPEPPAHCLFKKAVSDASAWAARQQALADYRTALATFEPHLDTTEVLHGLLREHHRLAAGDTDESACLHLARTAAHAHLAHQRRARRNPR